MDNSQIWEILPEIVNTLERSYDLFKRVTEDFRRYLSTRSKDRMKNSVLQIRRHVGEVDDIFSKLKARMEIARARNDLEGFNFHRQEILKIYGRIVETGNELRDILDHYKSYLDGYPKLRDALNLKLESEGVDDYEPEPRVCYDLTTFSWWVNVAGGYTREALEMLNEHLEFEY